MNRSDVMKVYIFRIKIMIAKLTAIWKCMLEFLEKKLEIYAVKNSMIFLLLLLYF